MAKEKRYLRGNAKVIRFDNGSSILSFSLDPKNAQEILDEFNQKRQEAGLKPTEFLNCAITKRKQTDMFGNTHSVYADFFTPDTDRADGNGGVQAPKESNENELPWE